jgi:hypothetical protein
MMAGAPPLGGAPGLPPDIPPEVLAALIASQGASGAPKSAPPQPPPPGLDPLSTWLASMLDNPSEEAQGDTQEAKKEPEEPEREKKPRRKTLPKPDPDWVKTQADLVVNFWLPRNSRMDDDYELYRLDRRRYLDDDDDTELFMRNTPYVMVEKGAALLGKQEPQIDVVAETELLEEAQQVEDFCRYMWRCWSRDYGKGIARNSLRRDLAHYLLLRGWGAMRVQYVPDAKDRSGKDLPIKVKLVDPRQIFPDPNDEGPEYIIHRYRASISQIIREWPDAAKLFEDYTQGEKNRDPSDDVEVTAYYDADWHYVYCDYGDIKPPTKHGYGFIPWVIRTSYGSPIRGTTLRAGSSGAGGSEWSRYAGVSILEGLRDAYLQESKVLSQLATEVKRRSDPPAIYKYDPANPEPLTHINRGAGEITSLIYNRESLEFIDLTPNPSAAMPLLEAARRDQELAGLPPMLFGQGDPVSGFNNALMSDAAEDQLNAPMQAMLDIYTEVTSMALTLLRDLHDEPIGYTRVDPSTGKVVAGSKFDPALIESVGTEVQINFKQIAPRDRAMMANLARMLTDAKLISMDTARDQFLGLDNPARENEKVLLDLIYLDKDVTKALSRAAAKRFSPELAKALDEVMRMGGGGPGEGGGPPPPDGGMPPLPPPGEMPPGPLPGMPPPPGVSPLPPDTLPPAMQGNPTVNLLQSAGGAAGGRAAGPLTPPGMSLPPL